MSEEFKSPILVTGSFTPGGTQDVNIISSIVLSTNITNASLVVTGPLTDTQLRATPIPVTIPVPVPVTQNTPPWTINGTVTANLGTIAGVATEITLAAIKAQTDKFTFTSTRLLVDGSGIVQPISGTITANQGTSPWVVSGTIITSPNVNIHDGSGNIIASTGTSLNVDVINTVPVTGTFFQATQPVSGVGNFTIIQPTGTNLHSTIDNFPVTQPVSAASLPLPTGASTSALQTQPGVDIGDVTINNAASAAAVNIQDGGNTITIDGNLTTITSITNPVTTKNLNSTTPLQSSVSVLTTNTVILASNSNRLGATIYNESGATIFLKLGTLASITSYTIQIVIGGYYEIPFMYTGEITGVTVAITATIRVTELT